MRPGILLIAAIAAKLLSGAIAEPHDGRVHRGRSMCEAAKTQIRKLEPYVRKVAKQADPQVIWEFFESETEPFQVMPVHHRFPEQHIPTRVLDMNLPEHLRTQMEADAIRVMQIEKYLYKARRKFCGTPDLQRTSLRCTATAWILNCLSIPPAIP